MTDKILRGIDKKLKAILIALALKETKRENQKKILKNVGLDQSEILEIIGISEVTKRVRKHRRKKK